MARETLDTEVTEGEGKVPDVSVLRVVAMLMGGCTIDEVPLGADITLCGSTMIEDGVACDEPDNGAWRTDVVESVTITGGTEDIAGLGAKLGC